MIVPISDSIRIRGNEHSWQLERLRRRKGDVDWESFKYFRSFREALGEAVQREIRLHPVKTLADAIEGVDELVQRFDAQISRQFVQGSSS